MNRIPNAASTGAAREALAVAGVMLFGLLAPVAADALLWALESLPAGVAALVGQFAWALGVVADMAASLL